MHLGLTELLMHIYVMTLYLTYQERTTKNSVILETNIPEWPVKCSTTVSFDILLEQVFKGAKPECQSNTMTQRIALTGL